MEITVYSALGNIAIIAGVFVGLVLSAIAMGVMAFKLGLLIACSYF